MSDIKCKTKYTLKCESGNFAKKDLEGTGSGGVDALLVLSLFYPEDTPADLHYYSFDGRNSGRELSGADLFDIFLLLGERLLQRDDINYSRRDLSLKAAELFLKLINKEQESRGGNIQ